MSQQFLNPNGASVVLASAAIAWIGISLGLVAGLGWLIDPNTLSLHAFYRARLVRAYLGATNQTRRRTGTRRRPAARPRDDGIGRAANALLAVLVETGRRHDVDAIVHPGHELLPGRSDGVPDPDWAAKVCHADTRFSACSSLGP